MMTAASASLHAAAAEAQIEFGDARAAAHRAVMIPDIIVVEMMMAEMIAEMIAAGHLHAPVTGRPPAGARDLRCSNSSRR